MKELTDQERKDSAIEALKLITKLLPPDKYGEDVYCEELYNRIVQLGGLLPKDLIDKLK